VTMATPTLECVGGPLDGERRDWRGSLGEIYSEALFDTPIVAEQGAVRGWGQYKACRRALTNSSYSIVYAWQG
jgi:hypothetical protein